RVSCSTNWAIHPDVACKDCAGPRRVGTAWSPRSGLSGPALFWQASRRLVLVATRQAAPPAVPRPVRRAHSGMLALKAQLPAMGDCPPEMAGPASSGDVVPCRPVPPLDPAPWPLRLRHPACQDFECRQTRGRAIVIVRGQLVAVHQAPDDPVATTTRAEETTPCIPLPEVGRSRYRAG